MLMTVLRGERAIKQRRALMRTFKQLKDGQSHLIRGLSDLLCCFCYCCLFIFIFSCI